MVFSSYLFLFYFLPTALLLYYAAPRRAKHLVLTALSYLFYGWANPLFVVLLFLSTLVDYGCGLAIGRGFHKRTALVASIVSNLSLLGFFKYFNFATASFDALVQAARDPANHGYPAMLPLRRVNYSCRWATTRFAGLV